MVTGPSVCFGCSGRPERNWQYIEEYRNQSEDSGSKETLDNGIERTSDASIHA